MKKEAGFREEQMVTIPAVPEVAGGGVGCVGSVPEGSVSRVSSCHVRNPAEVEHRIRGKLNTRSGMLNTESGHRERSSVA